MFFYKTKVNWKEGSDWKSSACWLVPVFSPENSSLEEINEAIDGFDAADRSGYNVLAVCKVKRHKYVIKEDDGTPTYILVTKNDEFTDYVHSELHGMMDDAIVCSKTGVNIDFKHMKKVDTI